MAFILLRYCKKIGHLSARPDKCPKKRQACELGRYGFGVEEVQMARSSHQYESWSTIR